MKSGNINEYNKKMSKIGKKPIDIPEGVTITEKDDVLEVKGKNAVLTVPILSGIEMKTEEGSITLSPTNKQKQTLSNWGTMSSLLKNAIYGSMNDFSKELAVKGVGFKVALEGNTLVLNVGFSHQVKFTVPEDVKVTVDKNNIKIEGASKWLVGETAANIRQIKKPEPYQGKGIRYVDEVVRRKAGKKAAEKAGPAA